MSSNAGWEESFVVTSYDVNFTGRMSPYSLFRRFQEVASTSAELLHVGYDDLLASHSAWLLSRVKVTIRKLPDWGEKVILRTWPKGVDRLFALRDFRLCSANGEELVLATSAWLLVDMEKGKPRRLESLPINLTFPGAEHAINESLDKLPAADSPKPVYEKIVLPSDIDVNNHVNNAEYVKWVMDCFDVDRLRQGGPRSIRVNYLDETLLGDQVRIAVGVKQQEGTRYLIEGVNSKTGKRLFQAAVDWT